MAEILSTVSPNGDQGTPSVGGSFYTSLLTWEAGQEKIIGAGDTERVECYAGPYNTPSGNDEGSVNVTGWTTDVTNNITIEAGPGGEHQGSFDQSVGYTLQMTNTGNFPALNIVQTGTVVQDLRIYSEGVDNVTDFYTLRAQSSNTTTIRRCIVEYAGATSNYTYASVLYCTAASTVFENNVFWLSNAANTSVVVGLNGSTTFYNNTFISEGTAPCVGLDKRALFNNNALRTGGLDFDSAGDQFFNTTALNNALSGASTPVTNMTGTQFNLSGSDGVDFTSPSTDDYTPFATGILAGNAVDLSGEFTDDIAGNPRTPPWDIGAYAIASAAATADSDAFTVTIASGSVTYTGSGNPQLTADIDDLGVGTYLDIVYSGSGNPQLTADIDDLGVGDYISGVPIEFNGTFGDIIIYNGVPFSADISPYYSGTFTPFTYSQVTGTLPPGITLDGNSGIISGTTTNNGPYSNQVFRGTDTILSTADSSPAVTITVEDEPIAGGGIYVGADPIITGDLYYGEAPIREAWVGIAKVWPPPGTQGGFDNLVEGLGALAYWKMNEDGGLGERDLADTINAGVFDVSLAPNQSFFINYGELPLFDFTNTSIGNGGSYFDRPLPDGFGGGPDFEIQEFSISAVINQTNTLTEDSPFITMGNAIARSTGWGINIVNASGIVKVFSGGTSAQTASGIYQSGLDQLLVITRDINGLWTIYRNGNLIDTVSLPGTITYQASDVINLWESNGGLYSGNTQRVAFYGSVLSQAEITALWREVPRG